MRTKLYSVMFVGAMFLMLNSVTAQSSETYLDCGEEPVEPGEKRQCFLQFSSGFNWSDYQYNWSVKPGMVVSESVESVTFVAPNNSDSEVVVEGFITDGSDRLFSTETLVEVVSNEKESPEIPDFSMKCEDQVATGDHASCEVEWESEPSSDLEYEWSVDGAGSVEGKGSSAVYRAPQALQVSKDSLSETATVTFRPVNSNDTESESIEIVLSSDNGSDEVSELKEKINEQEDRLQKNRQIIQEKEDQIERQNREISQYRSTIEDLRETVESLREKVNSTDETPERDLRENRSQESRDLNRDENRTEENENSSVRNSSDRQKDKTGEYKSDEPEGQENRSEKERTSNNSDSQEVKETEEKQESDSSESLLDKIRGLFS